ncbi:fatty acyl-AMP ligase [Streptomyces sp. RB6PN25]|uniref:Fatty acyl-AMP ligase n=1 Tax=Streptomyces humicola TaxID=2953240 RepID=A0ABT1PT39_9ACTN|nr:fatty acyl-AMP ligase [Streptomyces humicola]MCQ4079717.1 fatty acyl-AMP ligase [Streptomyces humicola]
MNASAMKQDTLIGHLARSAAQTPDFPAFTFVDFAVDGTGRPAAHTWARLDREVRAMAAALRRAGAGAEPVAVLAPQGPHYVIGFLAAMCAGAIAVPLFPPDLPGHADKLAAALDDARPTHILTTRAQRQLVVDFCAARAVCGGPPVLAVDDLALDRDPGAEEELAGVQPGPQDCAYLQYTSGSTRSPSGVEITHANVVANARHIAKAYDIRRDCNHVVGWLPLYHDMGLVLMVAVPVVGAVHSVITDPMAFVQQPVRWLRLLSQYAGAVTAAPNFAYDYCARRVADVDRRELSLDRTSVMINGSEPVRAVTLDRFQEAFESCGLRREVMRPSYGLAEATVFVSGSPHGQRPRVTAFDRDLLAGGVARATTAADCVPVTELVACGRPVDQEVAVVDAMSCRRQPDGRVGEIWVRGPNVARGYWRQAQASMEAFGAELDDGQSGRGGGWLRTGDLGVWYDGQLYITGRIKDLVIVDGTNHYPQDIELTVQNAHPAIRCDHVAAFAVATEGGEGLVVVAEHARHITDPEAVRDTAARAVRAAVATAHAVSVTDFVLAAPHTVPRTTSGKVARRACRERYLSGMWKSAQDAEPAAEDRTA